MARPTGECKPPNTATAFSRSMTSRAAVTPFDGLPSSSRRTSSILRPPRTPPFALISSMATVRPRLMASPESAEPPDSAATSATTTGGLAWVNPGTTDVVTTVRTSRKPSNERRAIGPPHECVRLPDSDAGVGAAALYHASVRAMVATAAGWRAHAALSATGGRAVVVAPLSTSLYAQVGDELIWVGPPGTPLHGRAVIVAGVVPLSAPGSSVHIEVDAVTPWAPRRDPWAIDVRDAARALNALLPALGKPRGLGRLLADDAGPDDLLLAR